MLSPERYRLPKRQSCLRTFQRHTSPSAMSAFSGLASESFRTRSFGWVGTHLGSCHVNLVASPNKVRWVQIKTKHKKTYVKSPVPGKCLTPSRSGSLSGRSMISSFGSNGVTTIWRMLSCSVPRSGPFDSLVDSVTR